MYVEHLEHWLWTQILVVITDPHFPSYSTWSISASSLKSIFKVYYSASSLYYATLSYHDFSPELPESPGYPFCILLESLLCYLVLHPAAMQSFRNRILLCHSLARYHLISPQHTQNKTQSPYH